MRNRVPYWYGPNTDPSVTSHHRERHSSGTPGFSGLSSETGSEGNKPATTASESALTEFNGEQSDSGVESVDSSETGKPADKTIELGGLAIVEMIPDESTE
ncbi:MAG TPA: hypothetical protein VNX65_03020 [Patescibacteria group bacterium]|jgi:hypothetical protein|nr:hypothetical protein [Patescibacteria group bacterium]